MKTPFRYSLSGSIKESRRTNRKTQKLKGVPLVDRFAGIDLSVERGDKETAQKQLQGFNARFQAMKQSCGNCHDAKRKEYVDESVQTLIDQLGQALNAPSVDPKVVEPLRQRIGAEGCMKCHRVHVPAAFAQLQSVKRK